MSKKSKKNLFLKYLLIIILLIGLSTAWLYKVYSDAYSSYKDNLVALNENGGVSFLSTDKFYRESGEEEDKAILISLKPGTSENGSVLIKNHDAVPASFDFKTSKFLLESSEGLANKIELMLQEQTIDLDPFEHQVVDYTLTVPKGAEEGKYSGSIVINAREDFVSQENLIGVKIGSGIRVVLDVTSEPLDYKRTAKWPDIKELSLKKAYAESKKLLFGALLLSSFILMYTAFKVKK